MLRYPTCLLPLLHGLFAAVLGTFIGMAAGLPAFRGVLLTIGIGLTVALHGAYDAALFSQDPRRGWRSASLCCPLMPFVAYSCSGERIFERLKRDQEAATTA